jgi:hypothetical protein
VQSNYEEISKWSLVHKTKAFYNWVNQLPSFIVIFIYAIIGALINSFLSPDWGFNTPTLALVFGMLIALFIITFVFDLARSIYMKRRFGHRTKLRAHSLGLFTGLLLVTVSRMANFLPGYCYGLVTGLVYKQNPSNREDGEGLAFGSVILLLIALVGWFTWIPIKESASAPDPSFLILTIDAAFATLWVSTLTAIVFGFMPMRFLYGEVLEKWKFSVWAIIYISGVFLFVYTLLNPAVGIYGKSDKVSWLAVLSLFIIFGVFSMLFWGYFRYRRKSPLLV